MVGTGYNRANAHDCGNSDPAAHGTLIYKGLLPIYLRFLPVVTSHVTWHFCVQTWGSPPTRSFYFNQGFFHKPKAFFSQLEFECFLLLPAPRFRLFSIACISSSRCTKRADRSQIIQLADVCIISILQLCILSGSNLERKQSETKPSLGRVPFLLSYLLFWTQKYLSTKKHKKKNSFLVSFSKTQLWMLNADFPLNIPFFSSPRALLLTRTPGLKPRLTPHINHGPVLQSSWNGCHLPSPSPQPLRLWAAATLMVSAAP